MRIRLLTVSHKVPSWIQEGYNEYAKRLPPAFALELVEISPEKRAATVDVKRMIEREGEKLLAAVKPQHLIIALDVKGSLWSTEELSQQLQKYDAIGQNIDLLIGGADGLSSACLQKANIKWSLSPLTFPHMLVRILVAEQIYRAWSMLHQHPYHR